MTDNRSYAASHLPPDERGARLRLIGLSLLACTLVAALGYAFYLREADSIESRVRERESVRVGFLAYFLESDLQPVEHDLQILSDGEGLHAFLSSGTASDLERATRRAVFVSRLRPNYDQVRFLDLSGHEVLRIAHGGTPVPADQLQDKSQRHYFQIASTLEPGQLYVSALDLNIENGRTETPFKPMLRFATPVFDRSGQRRGVYVINVLGRELLDRLQQAAPRVAHRLRLLNALGYWLKAASPEQEWGFQLPGRDGITLARSEPGLWSRILAEPSGHADYRGGLFTWQHVSPTAFSRNAHQSIATDAGDLIMASEVSAAEFTALLASLRQTFFVLTLGLLALTLGCVLFFDSRRRALASLRKNEESLRVTLHSIGDAVLATDTLGKVTRMNRIAEKLTGWSQAQASGRPISEVFRIVDEETRLPSRIPVDDVLATGKIEGLANHTVLLARTGQEFPIADSAAPIMDPGGAIIGVVLVFRDVTEEHAAAKALRESDDRYRTLFESIDEGFCIIQMIFDDHDKPVDYRFLEINPAFERQTGLSDALGKRMREIAPMHEAHWFEIYGRIAMTGEPQRFQNRAEQLHRTYDVYAFRFGAASNRQVAILFSDITERHRAQAELDLFFSLSLDFLCIVSGDGYFKRVSPAVTDMLGWDVGEFLAKPYIDSVHPDDHDATLREVEKQMRTGEKVLQFENRYRHKDGSWRVLSWRSVPHGETMYATARDVTELKKMEQALRQYNSQLELSVRERTSELSEANATLLRSERRFRALIEHAADAIAVVDANDKFTYASPSVAAVEAYGVDDLSGRSSLEHVHPDDLCVAHENLELARAQPEQPVPMLWRVQNKDGQWLWLEGYITNLLEDPAVAGMVINYRDVTERKEAEEKLRQFAQTLERSNRELQDFAFIASHDLQEPLRKIQTFGDRLLTRYGATFDDTGRDFMERILSAAERSRRLIGDLLTFSRVTSVAKQFERVDLNIVATQVIADLEVLLEQVGGRVEVATLPIIDAQPSQMFQLLLNLIGNALKFRRPDVSPVVTLNSEQRDGNVLLSVADNGIGFDGKYVEQIFQVFRRLVTRDEYDGNGIGLSVCRRIAEWHGGSITARSVIGRGSTFLITLPLRHIQAELSSDQAP